MPDKHEVGGSSPLEPTKNFAREVQKNIMFIENRIRNEQIIEKNINEKSDGFSVVG